MADAYSVLAVICFSLSVALSTFAQGLFILSDVLSIFTYVVSVFSKVFFDLANALFDLDKDCFIIVTTKIIAVLASPKLLFV